MQVYFYDTSALVKRYHKEDGTDIVDNAFRDKNVTRTISYISVIEFYSAFAKKVRMGMITEEDFRETIKTLVKDIKSGMIQLIYFGESEKKGAAELIHKYGLSRNLRTLDAIQLAIMKRLGVQVITHIYCADRTFSDLIKNEGFSIIDPERPQET